MPLTREKKDYIHSATSYFRQEREFTMRDKFAVAAMQTLIQTCWEKTSYYDIARTAYDLADTMIEVRNTKTKKG